MDNFNWGNQQTVLRTMLGKPAAHFDEAIKLCLRQHALMHPFEASEPGVQTIFDEMWEGLDEEKFKSTVAGDNKTIAWEVWHSTRIEDITMNILVADDVQVIRTDSWLTRMNAKVCDTGNAMTDEEIIALSESLSMKDLYEYRVAVARKTREIIRSLTVADLKKKMNNKSRLARITEEGAVVEGANWLIDFWGKKNAAGILLMPATRHHMVHINRSKKIKKKLMPSARTKKK